MAKVAAGLHPFAPEPSPDLLPHQIHWHFDLARLSAATVLLKRIGPIIARSKLRDLDDLHVHATAIRTNVDALRLVLGRRNPVAPTPPANQGSRDRLREASLVKQARTLVEAVTSDFLRAAHTRSLDGIRSDLARAVREVADQVDRILAALPTRTERVMAPDIMYMPGGPFELGGTYVVVFRANKSGILRLGSLGTFWMPAGYLLYVGSAFGQGGVASRTDRHLGGTGPLKWNVDYLRGFAKPTELWWTHHHIKVECVWSMALARMPECCCPAPTAGSNDCVRCPTHLYRMKVRPSVDVFATQLGLAGSGGYAINWQLASQAIGAENRRKPSVDLFPFSLFG